MTSLLPLCGAFVANLHSVKKARLQQLKHAHGDAVYTTDTKEIFVSVNGDLVLLAEFFRRWPEGPMRPGPASDTPYMEKNPRYKQAYEAIMLRAAEKR
jgi:hypothetical protein